MKTLKTERLLLTDWKISDARDLLEYGKNPNVGPAAGWPPYTNIWETFNMIVSVFKPAGVYCIRPKENGRAIGTISFDKDKHRPGVKCRELGYSMSEEYWGRGLMTEAVKAMIRHGFENLDLEMISVSTGPENTKSQRVIEKCGFTYEGTLRRAFLLWNGTKRDVLCYSMTREEYLEVYGEEAEQ